MRFEREIGDIYRLKVPFDGDVYTSVFLIKTPQGNVLVDCATTDRDVDEMIVPALKNAGAPIEKIDCLILTHAHGDHAGGKGRILQHNPAIKLEEKACSLAAYGLTVYEMKGHTLDCIGVFYEKSGTLISGDGLQGAGVGKYRAFAQSKEEYLKTIEKIKRDKAVENLLFSHAYEPWNSPRAFGREEVESCLKACEHYANKNMEI